MSAGVFPRAVLGVLLLTDEGLPLASSARVTGDGVVGLETHFTGERGLDLTLVATRATEMVSKCSSIVRSASYSPGEEDTTELSLDEELRVEDSGGGVERKTNAGWVNIVRRSDGVRGKHPDGLELVELTSIVRAGQNLVDGVCARPLVSAISLLVCRTYGRAQGQDRRGQPGWPEHGRGRTA